MAEAFPTAHNHVFLGGSHERNERRTWMVIALCTLMMIAEIVGGLLLGSIALVADGLHMSTHASALLLAALAYSYARRHAQDKRFSFGTGKFGDLAGYTSAIILAMIALLIGYEAVTRLIWPVVIHFNEAIPIAVLGLAVNVASVLLLGGGHDHSHGHSDAAGHEHDHEEAHYLQTRAGPVTLEIFENGVPPRFRLSCAGKELFAGDVTIETTRPDGARQIFAMTARGGYLKSADDIPEPHAFMVQMSLDRGADIHEVEFVEHEHAHGAAQRDNNMRAAVVHVLADAGVFVLVSWSAVRKHARLGLDGPRCRPAWRGRHCRVGLLACARYRWRLARHKSGPGHGRAYARSNRNRWRSIDRPAFMAAERPFGRDLVSRHAATAQAGVLSVGAAPIPLVVARDRRGENTGDPVRRFHPSHCWK